MHVVVPLAIIDTTLAKCAVTFMYPKRQLGKDWSWYEHFRHSWILVERSFPMVPRSVPTFPCCARRQLINMSSSMHV